jgi:hypothetical protein
MGYFLSHFALKCETRIVSRQFTLNPKPIYFTSVLLVWVLVCKAVFFCVCCTWNFHFLPPIPSGCGQQTYNFTLPTLLGPRMSERHHLISGGYSYHQIHRKDFYCSCLCGRCLLLFDAASLECMLRKEMDWDLQSPSFALSLTPRAQCAKSRRGEGIRTVAAPA